MPVNNKMKYKSKITPVDRYIIVVVNRFIGIIGASIIFIKLKWAPLREGMNYKHLFGVGLLASIGFTMSLFIANLSFSNPLYIQQAKILILIASLIGGTLGFSFLYFSTTKSKLKNQTYINHA